MPLPPGKSLPVLLLSAALAALAIVYFLIAPFIWLVKAMLNRRRARTRSEPRAVGRKLLVGLTLTGTGIVVNILVLALRMLGNSERAYAEVLPQIVINYGLTGLAALFVAALLFTWKKQRSVTTARDKRSAILPVAMIVVLVGELVFWQFYG